MNILTFDIEEWYTEKVYGQNRDFKYQQFDDMLSRVLDELEKHNLNATFFCVGKLAVYFPDVIRKIAAKGHEIGCHSDKHRWLDKMDESTLRNDTMDAINALEDISGQKVISYRAPAFSITEKNKWALGVLVECGIERDSSIFPNSRDFGGYPSFHVNTPCIIRWQGMSLREFPICMTSFVGKDIAFSGGGYFRVMPYGIIRHIMKGRDYNICYFHLRDLIHQKYKLSSRENYEKYFNEPGTLKNRVVRYLKNSAGRGDVFGKLTKLLCEESFVNLRIAEEQIHWETMKKVEL